MIKHLKKLLSYWERLKSAKEWEDTDYNPQYTTRVQARHDVLYMVDDENEGITYVVCTGTNWSVQEWASNIWAWPFKGFHRGFYKTAKRFYEQLKEMHWCFDRKIVVVCHSRGIYGVILAYMMNKVGVWDNPKCYSFGAPEFAKRKGIKLLNKSRLTHDRIYTAEDIVVGIGASKYWATKETQLPSVSGFDHVRYQQAVELAIKIEEEARE